MLIAFACLLGVETMVVGLLVPWLVVHVLDVLAVLQVLGLAATAVTRPHYIHKDTLVLREGTHFEVRVPLAAVATVQAARKDHNGRAVEQDDEKLTIAGPQSDRCARHIGRTTARRHRQSAAFPGGRTTSGRFGDQGCPSRHSMSCTTYKNPLYTVQSRTPLTSDGGSPDGP
jgi:hypothetical protein